MLGQLGGAPSCPHCGGKVYFSDEKAYMGQKWHKKCFACSQCNKALETSNAHMADGDTDSTLYCTGCFKQAVVRSSNGASTKAAGNAPRGGVSGHVNVDNAECCPRCGKRVYFAEQQLALGRKWHKSCFTCGECNKRVDSTSALDHDGELYCKSCHGRLFGPKGYGFAGGAGTMLSMDTGRPGEITTDNIPSTVQAHVAPVADQMRKLSVDSGDGLHCDVGLDCCPRCSGKVFLAEKRVAAGRSYHVSCFTCQQCNKKLDSSILTEKAGQIYCKACYGKMFAPKGYGYGVGAGALQMS